MLCCNRSYWLFHFFSFFGGASFIPDQIMILLRILFSKFSVACIQLFRERLSNKTVRDNAER